MESINKYTVDKIANIVQGKVVGINSSQTIDHILTDSRKILFPESTLFFALSSPRRDAHQFIPELLQRGVKSFVVEKIPGKEIINEASFIIVPDVLEALQCLAAKHRQQFDIPVIGITGSNGKTIVKEWLNQLLSPEFKIVRSPRSYNSQIGVPLSVWQMKSEHNLAIFEAGISVPGEMDHLEPIIKPTIGVFTNLGEAHQEGFKDYAQKLREKFVLFRNSNKLICNADIIAGFLDLKGNDKNILKREIQILTWSRKNPADFIVKTEVAEKKNTRINGEYRGKSIQFSIPFTDQASIDNAIICCCVMIAMGMDESFIQSRMQSLKSVGMRLELKSGINNCSVINDSYVADLNSLGIALDFLAQQGRQRSHTVILSDLLQSGMNQEELYNEVAKALSQRKISRLIGIGSAISAKKSVLEPGVKRADFFLTTSEFIRNFHPSQFRDEAILVKGARVFEFEQISHLLEQKVHQTVLEINLSYLVHNLREYQKLLKPSTKIMAMVKAFSYGSGTYEIANILQFHKIDYLAVAYADEGIDLRRAGISLPIMVMNPEENSFDALVAYNLEPEIFSFSLLQKFEAFLKGEGIPEFPVHIKIDSGMHRLGFEMDDIEKLLEFLIQSGRFKIQSVFSHLVASENPQEDSYTKQQAEILKTACERISKAIGYSFIRHISNSAAISRLPELQMDMVRVGIGLYGIDTSNSGQLELKEVATLKTSIAQIRNVKSGDTIGYGRAGKVVSDSRIATIRIGYADGFRRSLSKGNGKVLIRGKFAPLIGYIAMDMAMVDVSGIEGVTEEDEVIIFGPGLSIIDVAEWAGTIPYEIMTGISQRVQRVYFEE
ncbi:MAG: bifunctional UDP-N-acetylmuramoyl-tripeptide:D-alanyl-D-alanine ligase/alanine racemase [Bacteroidetes bacterium]|nr:MAG: bifunctional UDP-N-acetylmuramoyl-tripeptide:D-alanyl-D-alanine ligase/alanine racemase [Bacteroidota bacterium]